MPEKIVKIIRGDLIKAHRDADQILDAAKLESEKQINIAQIMASQIKKTAFSEGFQAGLAQASAIIGAAHRHRSMIEENAKEELAAIITAICRKIILIELHTTPDAVIDIITEHLNTVRRQRFIQIVLHPDDRALLQNRLMEISKNLMYPEEIRLQVDESVGRGGCIIKTPAGTIDASLETQLRTFEKIVSPKITL